MNAREMHYPRDPLGAYDDGAEVVMPIAPASIEPPPPAQTLNTGDELADGAGGRFMILGLLGKGGMGEVHRAEWWKRGASEGEVVAIKVMLAKNADDPKAAMRFNAEGKALREIRHLNVVQVLATGIRKKDRLAWMAMDLLHGKTLQEILEQHGKLPVPWAIQIVRDVCNGLQAVHSIALHRDIKPQNLFLCTDGVIRILDLGASKLLHGGLVKTTTGFQVGTLSYMSPEHIQNTDLDGRSDLFSLTIVLYQLLTGYYPFDFFEGVLPGWFEVCSRIIDKPHIPPDHQRRAPWLPRYIVEILNKGLAKDRTKRFRNAKEMGQDVLTARDEFARGRRGRDRAVDDVRSFTCPTAEGSVRAFGAEAEACRADARACRADASGPRCRCRHPPTRSPPRRSHHRRRWPLLPPKRCPSPSATGWRRGRGHDPRCCPKRWRSRACRASPPRGPIPHRRQRCLPLPPRTRATTTTRRGTPIPSCSPP
ncbi:MAG: serine/threonine protein kinase [Anaerolineales bacterium]|nr:serine/threonine protein kinase [Anaerolineales bacterium]